MGILGFYRAVVLVVGEDGARRRRLGVEGVRAPVVPVLGEVDGGVRGDEMETVARQWRPGWSAPP